MSVSSPGPVSGAPFPGQQGPALAPPVPPPRSGSRVISRNKLLLIILIAVGMVALVGGGVGLLLYNRATEIDRSTPTVAVRQFLHAAFVDKDDSRVKLFTCKQWTKERTAEVQRSFDPSVKVTWERVVLKSNQDGKALVTAQMRLVFQGLVDFQEWRFDVVKENGWRVCAAGPA